jgi:putative hydrolase of the HAD superfamily
MKDKVKVIAFDADDTLWINEPFFTEGEEQFHQLMERYMTRDAAHKVLYAIEIDNLSQYGYGIKGFMLSMIDAAIKISKGKLTSQEVDKIMQIGRDMLNKPVDLIDGVEEVLQSLSGKYRLVAATKGDLLDQERKFGKSGLSQYFEHIEILSEKTPEKYLKLIYQLRVAPEEFLMIGNSLKSDVLPVLEVGGYGIHIPFHTTWEHERVDGEIKHKRFKSYSKLSELLNLL